MAPFLILSPLRAVVFIVVSQALFGFYLGVSFITNHVGMPILAGERRAGVPPPPGAHLAEPVRPVLHRIHVRWTGHPDRAPPLPDHAPGNLRRARELVRPFCAERRIAYAEQSPWRAYCEVLVHLRTVGAGRSIPFVG